MEVAGGQWSRGGTLCVSSVGSACDRARAGVTKCVTVAVEWASRQCVPVEGPPGRVN